MWLTASDYVEAGFSPTDYYCNTSQTVIMVLKVIVYLFAHPNSKHVGNPEAWKCYTKWMQTNKDPNCINFIRYSSTSIRSHNLLSC